MKNVVLSLFDGISCCQQALIRKNIPYDTYFASEIHEPSIRVTQTRFPDTIQVGDVRHIDGYEMRRIGVNILTAGSPCQGFSMMGQRKGMVTIENISVSSLTQYLQLKAEGFQFHGQSYLFWEFIRLKTEINPKYFFLENVNMKKEWENIISAALGTNPIRINSSYFSAQNRPRIYWTNIPFDLIEDQGITIDMVIPNAVAGTGYHGKLIPEHLRVPGGFKWRKGEYEDNKNGKAYCLTTAAGKYRSKDGQVKAYTPEEAELLQTIDAGFTNVKGVSKSSRYEMIGNAWTVDVIANFFQNL